MSQLNILKPVTIIGQEYQAGDTASFNKTLIHREVAKISSGVQKLIDAGVVKAGDKEDTYVVIGEVAVDFIGQVYHKGDTFRFGKVFAYEDVVGVPAWVKKGATDGFWGIEGDDSGEVTPDPEPEPEPEVAITGIVVGPSSPSVEVGKTLQMTTTISPSNATDQSGVWSTADSAIATVDQSGVVTGVAAGSVVVSFTANSGGKKANRTLTVKEAVVKATSMRLVSPSNGLGVVGQTEQISVEFTPSNTTDKSGTWASTSTTVLTVDQSGLVTFVKAGTASVQFTSNGLSRSVSYEVTAS